MTKSHVLLIDDDPDLCELIEDTLDGDYTVHSCHDESSACDAFNTLNPGIVLLDINLPNGNGLALCEKFVAQADNYPMVLMISGDSSADMQLKAYSSGGSDFLPKPFRIKELRARVDKLNEFYQRHSQLQASNSEAEESAKNAMMEASQYGEVVRFYNAMYRAETLESIRDSFFALMKSLGLKTSIQLRSHETVSFDCCADECSPIELQIYEEFFRSKRLIVFESRLLINGQFVSAIVKNMPPDDEAGATRLREILDSIIEGIDNKLLDLQRLKLLKQTSQELSESNQRLSQVVKHHHQEIQDTAAQMIRSIDALLKTNEIASIDNENLSELTESLLGKVEGSFTNIANEAQVLDCLRLSLTTVLNQSSR